MSHSHNPIQEQREQQEALKHQLAQLSLYIKAGSVGNCSLQETLFHKASKHLWTQASAAQSTDPSPQCVSLHLE